VTPTSKQPFLLICFIALERLIARIEVSAVPVGQRVFSCELIVRGSSQPLG